MKKIIITIITSLLVATASFAQSHSNRIDFGIGALYERGFDATLAWEHETKYHNAWEYFLNGYIKWDECKSCGHVCPESFWKDYRTWGVGIAYKPCVYSSNTDKFVGGIHVGYEHNYSLRNGWALYWQAKCDMMLPNREDLFRTGIVIGFKIPTLKQ